MSRLSLHGAWKSLFSRKIAARRSPRSENFRRLRAELLEGRDLMAYFPDPNFGQGGIIVDAFGSNDQATSVLVQSDGKIVVAGNEGNATNNDFLFLRYTAAGAADHTFNAQGGAAYSIFGSTASALYSAALLSTGSIAGGGFAQFSETDSDFALIRVTNIGHTDDTFNGDGKVTTSIGDGFDAAFAIAAQSDDKIVAVGYTQVSGGNYDFAVVRYTTAGALDSSFSDDGIATFGSAQKTEFASGVAIQADGKIVVAGTAAGHPLVVRYNTNGTLDSSFDGDGAVELAVTASVVGVALQADGKIVLGASVGTEAATNFAAIRLTTAGAADTTFSGDGLAILDAGSKQDLPASVIVQANGRIVLGGSRVDAGGNQNPVMVAFTSTGVFDKTFGTDGRVVIDLGANEEGINALAGLSDGTIIAVGSTLLNGFNATLTIKFADIAPSITAFVVPTAAKEGQVVKLQATAIDPNQAASTLAFSWKVTGPGGFSKTLTGATVNIKLPDDGRFTVKLTVTNNLGVSATKSRVIAVSNAAPTLSFYSVPTTARVRSVVTFKATAKDPAGTFDKLSYTWVITGAGGFKKTLTGPTVQWTPTKTGKFTVTLTVRDGDGGKVTRATTIRVGA